MSTVVTGRRVLAAAVAGALLVASGPVVLPAARSAATLLLPAAAPEEITHYRLRTLPAAAYVAAIEAALAADDPELAQSVLVLADDNAVTVSADMRDRVTAAQAFAPGRMLREAWKGLSGGEATSPEALAGAVTADLTGITDVRDLLREGRAYLADQPYDPLTLGIAVAGLTLTGATVLSLGAATPGRVGVTALKVASKAGTLRAPLRRTLATVATDVIDRPALAEALRLVGRGEVSAARLSLGKAVRSAPLQTLRTLSVDLGTIAKNNGYRATHDVLKLADSPRDITRMGTLAARLGPKFRGAVALLGTGVLTLAGVMVTVTSWLLAAALWALSAAYFAYRVGRWIFRRVYTV